MISLAHDVRHAARRLLTRPGVAAIIVGSLALGIGANTMIFSLVNGLLLGATPYPDPDRVAVVWFTPPNEPGARVAATEANCAAVRDRARSFEHIGCVRPGLMATLADEGPEGGSPERLAGQQLTASAAAALGVMPVLGRWFTVAEEQQADPVLLISHRLWERRFGGAPDIVGRQIRATGLSPTATSATIIGVLPPQFELLDARADYWFPLAVDPVTATSPARQLLVIGRLRPEATPAQARAEMHVLALGLAEEAPLTNSGWGIFVERLQDTIRSGFNAPVLILQGVVAFVLLIACANVAGLLLAEGPTRRREMAVRSALGAGRWRIVRQSLTESLLLSTAGAVLGVMLAHAGVQALVASLPPGIPGLHAVSLDPRVLGFTGALALLTGLAFGIVPALHASRHDPTDDLKDSGRAGGAGTARMPFRSVLVTAQLALAVIASIGAGLMINSLVRLNAVDAGVDTSGLLTFQVQLAGRGYIRETGARTPSGLPAVEIAPRLRFVSEQIHERLAGMSGVHAATAMAATPPLSGVVRTYTTEIPARQAGLDHHTAPTQWFAVFPGHFETLRVPVLHGRDFTGEDTPTALQVAIINRTMAERFWPGGDPIGQEIQVGVFNEPRRQIVGIVADVRQSTRQQGPQPQVYVPFAQLPPIQSTVAAQGLDSLTYVARFSGDTAQFAAAVRQVVADADPLQAVENIQPLEQYVSNQLAGFRQYVLLLTGFGVMAVLLAAAGIYGVMAQAVRERTYEIGVRMALGATTREVSWLVLRRGVLLTAVGLVGGLGGALVLTRVLGSFLWEVTATDPVTFAGVLAVLAAISIAACYIPARRALRINPAIVLQQQGG